MHYFFTMQKQKIPYQILKETAKKCYGVKSQMLAYLAKNHNIVCSYQTLCRYLRKSPQILTESDDRAVDLAEKVLITAMQNYSRHPKIATDVAMYVLERKAKNRGYTKEFRIETEQKSTVSFADLSKATPEQLELFQVQI